MIQKYKISNKYKYFKEVDKIFRYRGIVKTRHGKLRFDANERVSNFDKTFLNKIKKKINSNYLTAYPETEKIYDILSSKFKMHREMFMLTAGSDVGIKNCFELLIKPKDEIITVHPTFGMVDVYAKLYRSKQIKITYNKKLELDYKKLIKKISNKTKLIILANPNSPTGTILNEKKIIFLLKRAKKFNSYVLIDEAYYGFYNYSAINLIRRFSNLIVLRTFSKAYGLAGCRVGFIIANKTLAQRLYKYRSMYEINSIGVLIVEEIIKSKNILNDYVKKTHNGKKLLTQNLSKFGFKYFNSYSNFIIIDFKSKALKKKVWNYFSRKGILVRNGPDIPALKNCLRFTLGPVKYMKIIVKNLKKFSK